MPYELAGGGCIPSVLTLISAFSSAPIVYTAEGEGIAKRLWRETMKELSFAEVQGIVDAFVVS